MANPFGDSAVGANPFNDAPVGANPFGDAAVEPAPLSSIIEPSLAQMVVGIKEGWESNVDTLARKQVADRVLSKRDAEQLRSGGSLADPDYVKRRQIVREMLNSPTEEEALVAAEQLKENRGTYAAAQEDISAAVGTPSEGYLPTGRELAVGVGSNLIRNVPGMVAGVALRKTPALGVGGALSLAMPPAETATEYAALDEGANFINADTAGDISGIAEGAWEIVPMGNLLKNLGKSKVTKLIRDYLVREVPSEMLTTLTEDIAMQVYAHPDKSLKELADEMIRNQVHTVLTTAISAPIQGGAAAGAVRLLDGRNNNTSTGQTPPPSPAPQDTSDVVLPPVLHDKLEAKQEREETDPLLGLDPAGVDSALVDARDEIEMISRRLAEGASADDFIVDIDNALDATVMGAEVLESQEVLKQSSVFTNQLVRGLDRVGLVSPDQGQSDDVIENNSVWHDPNDNVERTNRPITRILGLPEEGNVGTTWGNFDASQMDNVQGPVVLQVGVDSQTRPSEALAAVVQDVFNLAQQYLPQGRFVILPETMGRGQQGTYFYHNGVHYITPRHIGLTENRQGEQRTIEEHNWNSRQEFTSSVYHEFGHALVMAKVFEGVRNRTVMTRLAAELQSGKVSEESLKEVHPVVAKLMKDWMGARERVLSGEMSMEEAAARWFSPSKLINKQTLIDRLKDIRRKSKYRPYTAKELFEALGGVDNWLSFSEYLAEQMPKYMHWSGKWGKTATAKALKIDNITAASIGKFFEDVIEKMRKIFSTTSASKMVGSSEAFKEWLEHLAHSTEALTTSSVLNPEAAPTVAPIDWSDESTINNVKTALKGLLRDKVMDMQEYKEQLEALKEGRPEDVLAYVESLLGGKLQFDRIGGRGQFDLEVPPLNDFAFTTLETHGNQEYVSAKSLKTAAKKASAKPGELSLLLKAMKGAERLPFQDFVQRLSRFVRPFKVVRTERYGNIGKAQVGLHDALGSTWEIHGERELTKQSHIFDAKTVAFFRTFEDSDATYIADIQSDVFQKWEQYQQEEADADALAPISWVKDVWVPTVVQYAVKQAVRRGASVVRVATGDTMRQIQGWTEEEAAGEYRPIMQRYDGTIAKFVKHRYGATLSDDGKWLEFSTLQESDSAPIVPFGESGQAAPNNTLPSNGTLMFDRTTPSGRTLNQGLRRLLRLALQNADAIKKSWFKANAFHLRLLQLEQMAHMHPEIQPLQDAAKDESRFNEVKSFLVRKASEVVDSLSMMTKDTHKMFFDLTREEFRSGVHLTDLVQTANGWEHVPTERLAQAFEKFGYKAGEARTETVGKLYIDAKNAIQIQMDRLEKVLVAKRFRKFSDMREDMRHRAMAEVMIAFKRLRETPYWPQQRYGRYQVTVTKKGEEGELVRLYHGAFDTLEEQQAEYNKLKAKYKTGVKMSEKTLSENAAIVQMIPEEFLEDAIEMLGLSTEDATALRQLTDKGEASLGKIYDFGDRFAAGGSTDFFRNFSDFTLHTGNLVAKMEFRSYFDRHIRAVNALKAEEGKLGDKASVARRKLLDGVARELEAHKKQLFSPDTEFFNIRAIVSLMHLSFNVVTAGLNLMSLVFVYGWVATQTDAARAAGYMTKALAYGTNMAMNAEWAVTEEEKQLAEIIEMGYARGVIDQAYSYVLAGQASASILHRMASKSLVGKTARATVDNVGMYAFKKTEEIVRVVSMLTIAQALQSSGRYSGMLGTQELFDETAKQSRLVVGNYSSNARPSLMAGKVTSLATIFMTYSQMMAFHAYGGMEIGQRRQAKLNGESMSAIKSYTAYTALIMLALAGIEGLPGMESLLDIIEAVAKKMGWTSDLRKDMREYIAENTNIDPNLMMRGLGHDVGGFDLQSRLGLGRLVPGTDRIVNPQAGNAAEYYGALGMSLFGVFGGSLNAMYKMVDTWNSSSGTGMPWTMRVAQTMQEFPGTLGHGFDAYEWSRVGARGPRNGRVLLDENGMPRTATATEIAVRATGVKPTEVTQAQEESWTRKAVVNYWQGRRKGILDAYTYIGVQYPGDAEAMKGVVEAMHQYNRDLAAQGKEYVKAFGLKPGMLKQNLKMEEREGMKEEKGILPKRERLVSPDITEAFGGS